MMTEQIPAGWDYMKGREEDVAALLDARDAGTSTEDYDDPQEGLDEFPLSVQVERHVVIVLGTGGPHDELDVNLHTGTVTYGYYWGGERFEHTLPHSTPLARWALEVSDCYDE